MRRSLDVRCAKRLGLFVLALVGLPAATSLAAITVDPVANDVSPDPATWTSSTWAQIGIDTDGKLTIDGGSQISSGASYFGYAAGTTGTATITGAGSKWQRGEIGMSSWYVGVSGTGILNIENGGQVTSDPMGFGSYIFLGMNPGSLGQITVTGTGSKLGGSYGGSLIVGQRGTGILTIADGGEVSGMSLDLGQSSGSSGTATVTGAGSKLTVRMLSIGSPYGSGGTGTLNIENGGTVSSLVSYLGYSSGSTGSATVTGAGSQWNNSSSLYVGSNSSTASLTVANGGQVTTAALYASSSDLHGDGVINAKGGVLDDDLVFDSTHGSTQALTFGSGGTLNLELDGKNVLGAGYKGTGSLRIADGKSISSSSGYLGYNAGSTGTAIVTGAGSQWTNTGSLYVGSSGNGTLTVADGGQVTAAALYASLGDLHGNGTINVSGGAVLDADLVFDNTHGLTQVFSFGSGGTLNLTVDGKNALGVGYKGTGTLRIADGKAVSSTYGYLGDNAGSTGTATVTGSGSKWTNSNSLYVGDSGTGTLNIENGGEVSSTSSSYSSYVGYGSNSSGAVKVTGPGSKWTPSGSLYVGNSGTGTLNIENSGTVTSSSSYLGYNSGSTGTATVTGSGSKWTTNSLYVGNSGTGTLNIETGGAVTSFDSYLGYNAGSTGAATVTGTGSKWTNSGGLYVGHNGAGSLTVTDGGQVTTSSLYASLNDLHGNGTINVTSGAFLDADLVFDSTHGTTNTFAFGTGGVLNLAVDGKNALGVGYKGTGTLRIADGQTVASTNGYLGDTSASTGTAVVTGSGSKWMNSGSLYVGNSGTGTLTIENGGSVTSSSSSGFYLGYNSGSTGTATVRGTGSKWTTNNAFYIGHNGKGTLTVENSGNVSSYSFYVGYNGLGTLNIENNSVVTSSYSNLGYLSGSTGTVTVSGAGSKWTNTTHLFVGNNGAGTLTIENGGTVSSGSSSYVGYNSGSTGTVAVTGSGSSWTNSSSLCVGNSGIGILIIENGGVVTSSTYDSCLGYNSGSTGAATITGSGSKWTINNSSIYVGRSGAGTLNIENSGTVTSGSVYLGYNAGSTGVATVTGTGSKWTNSGGLYVGHNGTGALTVTDGGQVTTATLYAGSSDLHGNGTINVTSGGMLDADLVFDQAHGLTTIATFGSGGTLNFTTDGKSELGVGYKGAGSLRITDGQTVASTNGYLGYNSGSTGTATVTGVGSKWTTSSSLYVGYFGSGVLTIENGGIVTSSYSSYLGCNSGSAGTVTVTGTGSSWTNTGKLYVGHNGEGSLTVTDGGQVTTATLYAGSSDLHGNGTINVTSGGMLDADLVFDQAHGLTTIATFGSGGTLNFTTDGKSELGVGYSGTGSLRIADGQTVSSTAGYLGYNAASTGTAVVTGSGSKWTNINELYVGNCGTGTLNIENGGTVISAASYSCGASSSCLGYSSGSTGTVMVSGAGSKWIANGNVYVGYNGTGALTIENGGTVTTSTYSYHPYLGYNSGSAGTVTVRGTGSNWTIYNASIYVGNSGTGKLNVENGGTVASSSAYLGYDSGSTGTATIAGIGSKWTLSSLVVGNSGSGTLAIENGGVVTCSGLSYLGYKSGSVGEATVTGSGSKWTTNSNLYVGYSGIGTLIVGSGGVVTPDIPYPYSAYDSYLGYNVGSFGTATVAGLGSKWTNSRKLYVGYNGVGALTVTDGGQVTTSLLYAALSDLHGNGTINVTSGAILDTDLIFDKTHGSKQALTFGSGGTLSLNLDGQLELGVGYKKAGNLRIVDSQVVSSTDGYLGYQAGSIGTATIMGTGSTWASSGNIYVGYSGAGTLAVANGGTVTCLLFNSYYGLSIGYYAGSIGTVTVTGSDSKLTRVGAINIGHEGIGILRIENSGTVCSGPAEIGHNSGSTGTVTVTGANSQWNNNGYLWVGNYGMGTLNIENGATVVTEVSFSSASYLGYNSGSTGTVTVVGAGSKWVNAGKLYVGYNGVGTLSVADGGQVTTATLYAGSSDLHGNGTINVTSGGVLDADLVFDQAHGLTTIATFGSGGTLNFTTDGKSELGVGYKGAGSLRITDGQTVASMNGSLGYYSGSTGMATVTGIGSQWTTGGLNVGRGGIGTLAIENGGTVISAPSPYYPYTNYFSIGSFSGSTGTVAVTGPGSKLTIIGCSLGVGGSGTGTLNIDNGGTVSSGSSYLGYNSGSMGTVNVADLGSKWINSGSLYIGYDNSSVNRGTGRLNITYGGLVTAQNVSINNSQSLLSMDIGFDSTLNINSGTGTLTNNGKVRFTAAANVAAGEYQPILAGTFTGSGIYQALGGRWDNTRHVFIVDAAQAGSIDDTINLDLASSRRAAITDATSGQTLVGASFLSGTGSISFAADELTSSEESALSLMLTAGSDLLAGYQFTVTGTTISSTNPVYLSLFVGRDYDEDTFKLWHYDGTAWTAFLPTDLSYDGQFASFTVTGFSGYAISGELIPEPASLGLLALSSVVLLMRRPRIS